MSDTNETLTTPAAPETAEVSKPAKKKSAAGSLTFKVSAKGAVSVYGLGRFPVTLYYEQWKRLLSSVPQLDTFLEENKAQLKSKEDSAATPEEQEPTREAD
jgi:hypothetical protein